MPKWIGVVVGAAEIAGGIVAGVFGAVPLSAMLISSGAGMLISGIGTMLAQGPVKGTSTASRNPLAPWNVVYGRSKLGGTLVFINEFGDNNKYLDLIFVLACHPCKSFDALLLDGQRVRLDQNGCSFTPTQQTVNILSISRTNDVVTVQTDGAITDLQVGDSLQIKNVSGTLDSDKSFNGIFPVTPVDPTHFTYICGGPARSLSGTGQVTTLWPNYKAKIHAEWLLGNHTATFPGMLNGTPYDGDPGNLVTNDSNPWDASHLLLGKTSVFLRFHYNDTIFANGLPTIAFRISGKNDIYDPRASSVSNILGRPTTLLNGWTNNAHVGAYEEGVDQGYGWGLNNDTTDAYANPGNAIDADLTTAASIVYRGTHRYAGCVWQFGHVPPSSPVGSLWLNVLSAVNPFSETGRSAGIWYSLDNGTTWIEIYNTPDHPQGWDSIHLDASTDTTKLQVMAFTDAHDDMAHYVYDIQLSSGPGTSNANGTGYTENAALCIADYLCQQTWGFKCSYGTDLPLAPLIAAANICDEPVSLAAGGTEPRYACNGGFPLTLKRGEVLQNLLTSCGGRITYQNGQYIIWPASWFGNSLLAAPPVPVPPGQAVAWSYAQTFTPPGFHMMGPIPPSIWNGLTGVGGDSFSTSTSGTIQISGGDVFADPSLAIQWTDFPLPSEIPAGATITAVYAVATGVELGGQDATLQVNGGPNWDGTPMNVGSLSGLTIKLFAACSLPGGASAGTVGFLAAAVYYDLPEGSNPIQAFPGSPDILPILGGPFRWRQKVSIRDLYNGVKGTYISPVNGWQASDIPPYAQDTDHGYTSGGSPMFPFGDANLEADGGDRRWYDIQLPFTISCPCAQRLCKVELLRRRQQGTGTFIFNLSMYKATVLDVAQMTFPTLGWVNKLLEIQAHRFTLTKQQNSAGEEVLALATEIDVQETDPSVYAWSPSEELTAQGFQQGTSGKSTNPVGVAPTYTNVPPYSLSQPSATEVDMEAVQVTFSDGVVANYHARSLTIPAVTVQTWFYVYVIDPDMLGDIPGTSLVGVADATTTNVGVTGFIYMGAILTLPNGGGTRILPGGWPAPPSFQVGP